MNFKEKEIEIKKSYKAQRIVLYALLGFIYMSFIGLQLGRIQAIADYNYSLHEIMYVPFSIAIFAVPALFLIYLVLFIKNLRKRGRKKANLKTIVQSFLIISSIVIILFITEYQFNEVSTSGIFKVEQKLHEDRKYYLLLQDTKVRLSHNEFQLIEEKEEYLVSFKWNKRNPNEGKLETIEPLN